MRLLAQSFQRALAGAGLVVGLVGISAPRPANAQPPTDDAVLVLTNARVLDAATGFRPGLQTVVVRGRTIERVGAGGATPIGARVVDVGGRYVLPGLIDVHTHISSLAAARRALESGVTTVRSASTSNYQDVGIRELVRAGKLAGPDMLAAGVFVTPDLGETVLADPRLVALAGGVRTPDELAALVRINLDRGVDWIKTRGTERAGLPNTDPRKQTYTQQQLRAVVDAAATRQVPVLVHAHGDEGAYAAVRAGARSIEHGTYLSDSTLALMKAQGTWLVPTYVTVEDLTQPGGDYADPILTLRGRHMLPRLAETVRRAHAMGVRIATGVDTSYGPESLSRVAHECAAFVRLGMTPLEALAAATTGAAELLGLGAKTGAVQPGREADLIVVERNPLSDITALEDVLVVVSNGQLALNRLPFGVPIDDPMARGSRPVPPR